MLCEFVYFNKLQTKNTLQAHAILDSIQDWK